MARQEIEHLENTDEMLNNHETNCPSSSSDAFYNGLAQQSSSHTKQTINFTKTTLPSNEIESANFSNEISFTTPSEISSNTNEKEPIKRLNKIKADSKEIKNKVC